MLGSAEQLCRTIRGLKMRVGVALKPKTLLPDTQLYSLLDKGLVDLVLVMTVEPGFGGQKFMPECLEKVLDFLISSCSNA